MTASAPERFEHPADVHVWQADVGDASPEAYAVLSPDEQARADRFCRPADRTRFAASHAALRQILAAYLPDGPHPSALRFRVAEQGKPQLVMPSGAPDLRFSLAHSGSLALVAVALGREVGVDVELERPLPDVLRLAGRVAAPHEQEALQRLDARARVRAFFQLWVAKEAVLKARSTGLHADPRRVLLDGLGTGAVRLRDAGLDGGLGDSAAWALHPVDVQEGYRAAVVVCGTSCRVVRRTHTTLRRL